MKGSGGGSGKPWMLLVSPGRALTTSPPLGLPGLDDEMKKNGRLTNVAVLLFFVVLAIIHTYPMVSNIKSATPVSLASVCFLYAASEQSILFFEEAPFDLYEALDPSIAGPLKSPLLLTPYGFGSFFIFAPFYLLTGNLYFSANMFLLVVLSCSAFTLFLLARYLTGSIRAALLAGTVFVFSTPSFSLLRDLWLLNLIVFPLIFLCFFRFIHEQKKIFLFYASILLALDFYLVVYHFIFALYLLLIISLLERKAVFKRTNLGAMALSAVTGVLLTLPLALPYIATRSAYGVDLHSASLQGVFPNFPGEWLSVSHDNVLYGKWLSKPRYADDPTAQLEFFPGALVWIFLLIGAFKGAFKSSRGLFYLSVLLAVILLTTSWYPLHFARQGHGENIPHLYAPFFTYLPLIEYVRILPRYIVVFNFCAAILVAGGYLWLEKKIPHKYVYAAFALLFVFINLENLSLPRKMYEYDDIFGPGEAVVWLKTSSVFQDRSEAILYIPHEFGDIRSGVPRARALLDFLVPVFRHLHLRQPTYSNIFSFTPRGYTLPEMRTFPEEISQKFFRAMGTKVVVVYEKLLDGEDRARYGRKNMEAKRLRHLKVLGDGENVYLLEAKVRVVDEIVMYSESQEGRIRFWFATPKYHRRRSAGEPLDPDSAGEFWVNPRHCMKQEIEVSAVDTKGRKHTAAFTYNLPLVIGGRPISAFEWNTEPDQRYEDVAVEYDEDYIVNAVNPGPF